MTETITLGTGPDTFETYVARPEGPVRGAVIVIHEIWGLAAHITDIADRFAAEGYLAVAPDLLSHAGIHPALGEELLQIMVSEDEKVRTEGQPRLREAFSAIHAPEFGAWAVARLIEVVDHLEQQPGVDGRIVVTGFCFGGSYSFALAAADPRVRAAVPFYGAPPALDQLGSIRVPVHAFYGEQDERLMQTLPEVRKAMLEADVDFQDKVYPDAGHAFFNDTNSRAYREQAAQDAWAIPLSVFEKALA